MNAFLFIFQVCCFYGGFYGTTNQISSWLSGRAESLEIWGGQYLCGGHNLFPLVEIGLTYVPKSGGALAPPAPPGTTPLGSLITVYSCCKRNGITQTNVSCPLIRADGRSKNLEGQ